MSVIDELLSHNRNYVAQHGQHVAGPAGKADAEVADINKRLGIHVRSAPSGRGPHPGF